MPDPLSLVTLAAAIGGATGKFVEKAWDSGEKWITSYFKNHREAARETAERNSSEFIKKLGLRLKMLEDSGEIQAVEIEVALERPEFSVVLQHALLASAQTDDDEKHTLLSDLVAAHLQAKPESMLSLTSKMACEVVSNLTKNQLNLLGFVSTLRHLTLGGPLTPMDYAKWLTGILSPYTNVSCSTLDVLHLHALGCIHQSPFGIDLWSVFTGKNPPGLDASFRDTGEFRHVTKLWPIVQTLQLSSVGQLLGHQVFSIHSGIPVRLLDNYEWSGI